mmetsp:Transcript_28195/g.5137  ORF Transcript_28195/g.5137 Transcript_28195/m.5137 type:complete len:108 (-) Transcript_28195:280-603(-)
MNYLTIALIVSRIIQITKIYLHRSIPQLLYLHNNTAFTADKTPPKGQQAKNIGRIQEYLIARYSFIIVEDTPASPPTPIPKRIMNTANIPASTLKIKIANAINLIKH